jgi:hypothetical protein
MMGARGGSAPLIAWACLQLALGTMLALWSGGAPALLFLVGAGVLLLLAAWNRAVPAPGGPRTLAATSLPVVVLAVGAALAAIGLTAGLWLVLIGGELAAFAVVWLGRELAGERRVDR